MTQKPPSGPKEKEGPHNSWELMKMTGIEPSEGIVVAHFPPKLTGLMATGEDYYYAQWIRVRGIVAEWPGLGTRMIDLLPDPIESRIKWWRVREFARAYGYNSVPEVWNGATRDIPDEYFSPGGFIGLRLYNSGPWFWPLERPEMVLEEDPNEQKMVALAKEYKL